MNTNLTKLFYWSWNKNFAAAIDSRQIYEDLWLFEKLEQKLFFQKMEAAIFPSYNFWPEMHTFLLTFPTFQPRHQPKAEAKFLNTPEDFLKEALQYCLACWKYFPQIFRDFYNCYPKCDVIFSEVEFVYLDYWTQLPKVIASLLSELLVRDMPFREVMAASGGLMFYKQTAIFPPQFVSTFSNEALHAHIIDFLAGDDKTKSFFQVIQLYLNHRPLIKEKCLKDLQDKGLEVTEETLVKYFLSYYIFKDVSLEALRFVVANSDLNNKNPFKLKRELWVKTWNNFTEEERQNVIKRLSSSLEDMRKKVETAAAKTHEEKVAEQLAFLKELEAPKWFENLKVAMIPLNELETSLKKND